MSMLENPSGDTLRDLQVRLTKRLNYVALIACAVAAIILIVFSASLFSFRSALSTLQRLLVKLAPQNLDLETILDQTANRTLGFQEILAINLPERTDHRDGLILASAVSNIDVRFVDGIRASTIPSKALPPNYDGHILDGQIGAWRAHMNAIDQVVKRGLSSALIIEDDVDWDVRLKDILRDFSISSNALLEATPGSTLAFDRFSSNPAPRISPYGDGWDVLWLGHCDSGLTTSGSRVIHPNDITDPEIQYLRSWDINAVTPLAIYPNHTRVIVPVFDGVCSLAYAVSQKEARAILNSIGLKSLNNPYDLMLRDFCTGEGGREPHSCLSVLPQIFDHYRATGAEKADNGINQEAGQKLCKNAYTLNIRWSVRMNMERILRGETSYEDQYPDSS